MNVNVNVNAPLLLSGVKTVYKSDGSITDESHPAFRPHLMQGWTPDFVPSMVEDATQVILGSDCATVALQLRYSCAIVAL